MYRVVIAALLGWLSIMSIAMCDHGAVDEKEPVVKRYPAPQAVFEELREANQRGDWRSVYFLCTKQGQRDLVFEAVYLTGLRGGQTLEAMNEAKDKFGASDAELEKTYFEAYKNKHGHDDVIDKYLAKLNQYLESEAKGSEGSWPDKEGEAAHAFPPDRDLLRQTAYDATKHKVEFYVAIKEIDGRKHPPLIIGKLEQLVIHGDTATGHARISSEPTSGESSVPYDKPYKFRKVSGGWLIDTP